MKITTEGLLEMGFKYYQSSVELYFEIDNDTEIVYQSSKEFSLYHDGAFIVDLDFKTIEDIKQFIKYLKK